ncbi:MAG: hypothetical protein ISR01_05630 [Chitinophagales bacterium]|nr:hypothetical protein [Chitinophagales bacterium]MDC3209267.1 hypothetical protein [Chitinophagales bacterium]
MHGIEPYWRWRDLYKAEEDEYSPFFEREYSEFEFTHAIYDHAIHPQWDYIGSPTLFIKILFVDYDDGMAVVELLGEWNDTINNDIMFFKRDVIDALTKNGIYRFIIIGENVLNFHGQSEDYYDEWFNDIIDEGGWIAFVNFNAHVLEEMMSENIHYYMHSNQELQSLNWRKYSPDKLLVLVEDKLLRALHS